VAEIRRYTEGYSGGKYSERARRGLTSRKSVAMRVTSPAPVKKYNMHREHDIQAACVRV
jgi:hypothetical protein